MCARESVCVCACLPAHFEEGAGWVGGYILRPSLPSRVCGGLSDLVWLVCLLDIYQNIPLSYYLSPSPSLSLPSEVLT